ncbi:type II toxin-antitoxin system VapC family toxin [Gordonia sp. w5E2]|uniref:type II toxin-antitoxin system VapC family toxin n=1 Tax=unclassified Gordonia (in: high G+C Gram-positive bacteria) TaxID=2657482 RepID=UPI0007EA225C|nr:MULTISPECIES: type II toxin-antitoxin system VapC family toxin [unclassified Gordonia (in: high G+C Gram-positive bacteria)]OBC07964.1 ribonuclease [Gordonia sp. 852002-50816_SCH5313054-a]OBC21182.1 ribonuclease [Gordonia sp. 852002-50816_SCH5313054-c]
MILVDTSVWIDHLHAKDERLPSLLADDEIGCHPLVVEELALGSIANRDVIIDLLSNLVQFPVLTHAELLHLVESRKLWGRGLSPVDAGLLGSAILVDGATLWTRDKRLRAACVDVGVDCVLE